MSLSWLFHPPSADSEILSDNALSFRAQHAAIDAVEKSKDELSKAESRLADAQDKYGDEDNWNEARVLAKAEEHYEDMLAELEANERKLKWENDKRRQLVWPRTIERTKQLLSSIDWDKLRPFRNFHDN